MMSILGFLLALVVGVFVAPILGGLITGVDRRITARLQSRLGPPILQPFYDVAKLLGKEKLLNNSWQAFCAYVYLVAAATSVVLFFLQSDLLLIFFVQAVGAVFLVIGAMSVPSPYSQIGAQRELIQVLTYEPLLVLVLAGIYVHTGTFKISGIYALEDPMLFKLPLLFLVLGYALTIKLRKSPFDISASAHAHQEIVRGVYTEFSGPYLAILEIAHFYEMVLILGLVSLFWSTSFVGMLVLVALTYLAEILVDNVSSRMTWRWMVSSAWAVGLTLTLINLLSLTM
ncbi:respiratory chain complex I subunit 1 family protein [Megalodesulfovibrio gigas]|nr:complex I subunit 1 family protein [Megalodesulfovibrio gigas]